MRRPRRRDHRSQECSQWVEWGGQRIWAVGYTEGGAPYGLTAEELEAELTGRTDREDDRRGHRVDWADAKDALYRLLEREGKQPNADAVGYVRPIGEGLSNRVFGTSIRLDSGQEEWVVVKLPSPDAEPDRDRRVRKEAETLRYLTAHALPFKVPRPVGEIETPIGLATVQDWVDGTPIDLRTDVVMGEPTWKLVARVAASIHALDPEPLRAHLPVHLTRRHHALARAASLDVLDEPEGRETAAWVHEHLPPETPSTLLHGDLLGQNLKLDLDATYIGVIDWAEAQIGDPAYELAIVTRCAKKVFGRSDGRERLVEQYNREARAPVTHADVSLHELMISAHWYREACGSHGTGSPHAENQRLAWRSLLKRVTRGTVS